MKLSLRDRPEAGGWAALFALVAALAHGQAILAGNGQFDPTALELLGVAVAALVLGTVFSTRPGAGEPLARATRALAVGGIGLQFFQLATEPPGWDLQDVPARNYLALLAAFAALTPPIVLGWWPGRRLHRAAWLAAFAAIGAWIIVVSPEPYIDVYHWTHQAANALGEGRNPFAIHMRNLYGEQAIYDKGENLYGRPLSADAQWVLAGYPYPPLSLLLSACGVLFGDMRWANLVLLVVAGAALLAARGRFAPLGSAVLLSSPAVFLMVQQAWTDAYCLGLLALTAALAARSSPLTPWALGLALVSKQYMVFLAPLGLLLVPAPWDRRRVALFAAKTVLAGTVVTLPWILLDPQAFFNSVYTPGVRFRQSSLSFLRLIVGDTVTPLANTMPFVLLLSAYVLIVFTSARGAAGFALSSALVLGAFFAFAKSSFTNQHFLILGCAATAFACGSRGTAQPPPAS